MTTADFNSFYENWTEKAMANNNDNLSNVFDKYITLYIIYNSLCSKTLEVLHGLGVKLPRKILDNEAATKYVAAYLGAAEILENLNHNGNSSDIDSLIFVIRDEIFSIALYYGKIQRQKDVLILKELESTDALKKSMAILKVIYHVRCNIFHGHKNLMEYQRLLLEPLIRILQTINLQLYVKLSR